MGEVLVLAPFWVMDKALGTLHFVWGKGSSEGGSLMGRHVLKLKLLLKLFFNYNHDNNNFKILKRTSHNSDMN